MFAVRRSHVRPLAHLSFVVRPNTSDRPTFDTLDCYWVVFRLKRRANATDFAVLFEHCFGAKMAIL